MKLQKLLNGMLAFLLFLLGTSAVGGGILLLAGPDGSLLGMHTDYIRETPFDSYLIPGIILTLFLGLMPLLSLILLIWPSGNAIFLRISLFRTFSPAWNLALYSGMAGVIWILVQMSMTEPFWLQGAVLSECLLMVMLCLSAPVRKAHRSGNEKD